MSATERWGDIGGQQVNRLELGVVVPGTGQLRLAGMEAEETTPEGSQESISEWGVAVWLLHGGRMPERKTEGAVGWDFYAHSIVTPHEMNLEEPYRRRTIFDFQTLPKSASLQEHVIIDPDDTERLAYTLHPDEVIFVSGGFTLGIPHGLYFKVQERSGFATRLISAVNAGAVIDTDYTGEIGVMLRNDSGTDFVLQRDMRVAQLLPYPAITPNLQQVQSRQEIRETARGAQGFGSTGWSG